MSNNDSFIDEVTEEVRRDRLYGLMRRYGWIAILLVVVLVGGAAFREYQKASAERAAQAFGDAILAALETGESEDRIAALGAIEAPNEGGRAILQMLLASEEASAGQDAAAADRLQQVATTEEIPQIYRQIASYKALSRDGSDLGLDERRAGFEALAVPGQPLRLLAEEQLALIEIETGGADAAIARLQRIAEDSEATAGLRNRATQLIVALGGTPDGG